MVAYVQTGYWTSGYAVGDEYLLNGTAVSQATAQASLSVDYALSCNAVGDASLVGSLVIDYSLLAVAKSSATAFATLSGGSPVYHQSELFTVHGSWRDYRINY